ncbi:MAG: hypothetical protein ABFS32_18970 [Bacteroidota bacterium]
MDSAKVIVEGDDRTYYTPAIIGVERSKQDVSIVLKKDSLITQFNLDSRLSAAFWIGNMYSWFIPGYIIDLHSPKRFTYPNRNHIPLSGSRNFITRPINKYWSSWQKPKKGQFSIKLSIPESNHFYMFRVEDYGTSFGFLGLTGGLEYYISDKLSISSNYGFITDVEIPIPAPYDPYGKYDRNFAQLINFQMGTDIHAWHFDIGLQSNKIVYTLNEVSSFYPVYIDTTYYRIDQRNLGLSFSTYYKLTDGFNVGLNYNPSFFSWRDGYYKNEYSHILFLELIFRFVAIRPEMKIY